MNKNLRPSAEHTYPSFGAISCLKPVIEGLEGYNLLTSNGDILILSKRTDIYSFNRATDPEPKFIFTDENFPETACFISEKEIMVSNFYETYRLDITTAERTLRPEDLPPVTFETDPEYSLSATIAPMKLSRAYNSGSDRVLEEADSKKIAAAMNKLYSRFTTLAANSSQHIAPALVRYRLVDRSGDTLYLSSPLLMTGGNAGSDLSKGVRFSLDGENTPTIHASCNSFKINLKVPKVVQQSVAELHVEISEDFSPVDPSGEVSATIQRSSQDGTFYIMAHHAGVMDGNTSVRQRIVDFINKPAFYTANIILKPFNGNGRSITVGAPNRSMPVREASPSSLVNKTFSVSSLERCGETVVGANPRIYNIKGHNPVSFIADTVEAEGTATFCEAWVYYPSGVYSTFYSEIKDLKPVALNPLITVPATDAVRIKLNFTLPDGKEYSLQFPLESSPGGYISYYLSNDMEPVPLAGNEATLPPLSILPPVLESDNPGNIITFPTGFCNSPKSIVAVADFPIQAIRQGTGSSTGWDHVRSRFYMFGKDGIFLGVAKADSQVASVAKVAGHPVVSERDVAVTPEGLYAVTANGALVSVAGNRASVVDRPGYGHLCYDNVHRELNILNADSQEYARVFNLRDSSLYLRSLPGTPSETMNAPEGCWAVVPGKGLFLFGVEDRSIPSYVEMDRLYLPFRQKNAARRWLKMALELTSPDEVDLEVTVLADHGAGTSESRPVFIRELSGQVNSPFLFSVPNPAGRALHALLRGSLPSSARILNFEITQ